MNNGGKAEKENTPNEANLQEEEVRTLFVSGLPLDIKPRELYLLFRPFKGYEGSLIKLTSKQPVGFVSFDSRSEAEAAKNALNFSADTSSFVCGAEDRTRAACMLGERATG